MTTTIRISVIAVFFLCSFAPTQSDNVDFSCLKVHKASNTCHFNFKIDGAKYRFMDIGCKYSKKKDEVIKKAKEGTLALAREWKIECPEQKEIKPKQEGF
jgi:hypothetical protein